jgi:ketosteroid isomerase-like protein
MAMKRLPAAEEDKRSVGEWYSRWDKFVADVDFKPVREMFAEDVVAFGSKVEMMTSQAQLEREQWRAVWPSIEDYRYDLSTLEVITSPDRLMAMGAVMFRSTGFHPDGAKFVRNGRSTCTFMRTAIGAPWICTHSHLSVSPGTPGISHGQRPAKS